MKKALSLILSMMMAVSMCLPAFAEEATTPADAPMLNATADIRPTESTETLTTDETVPNTEITFGKAIEAPTDDDTQAENSAEINFDASNMPSGTTNQSTIVSRLNTLKSLVPNGNYFSANGAACTHSGGTTCSNCEQHKAMSRIGLTSRYTAQAWTCYGFARFVWEYLFGDYYSSTNRKYVAQANTANSSQLSAALAQAAPGDVLECYSKENGSGFIHIAIIVGTSGTTANVCESNYSVPNRIHWGAESYGGVKSIVIYRHPNYNPGIGSANISLTMQGCVSATETTAKLQATINNPNRKTIDEDGIYWGTDRNNLTRIVEGCGRNLASFDAWFNMGAEYVPPLTPGQTYYYKIFVTSGGVEYATDVIWVTMQDNTAPSITNVEIFDADSTGYTVRCTVTDNGIIDRVQFPTWTEYNGQDDLAVNWETNSAVSGTRSGNTWIFRVNDSAHNFERGQYWTHIYAYDAVGNSSFREAGGSNVQNTYRSASSTTYGGHRYELYNDILTWSEAKARAEAMGGYLATITSQSEQNTIAAMVGGQYRSEYWIGGQTVNGSQTWITGEPFTYSNWGTGQPDNYNGVEFYYLIWKSSFQWNDVHNNYLTPGFIVEYGLDVTSVTLNKTSLVLTAGGSETLTATIAPTNATDKTVTWTSSNTAVATVSNGKVTAVKAGTATIIAKSSNGKTATCAVTVTAPAETGVAAFVERMYTVALGRESDPKGKADWVAGLKEHRVTGAQVAKGFIISDEFAARKLTDDEFLAVVYKTFFNRAPDAGGKADWVKALSAGMSREFVVCGFAVSDEFNNLCSSYGIIRGTITSTQARDKNFNLTSFVSRLYSLLLNRKGDEKGLNDWCGGLINKVVTPKAVAHDFVFSAEFEKNHYTDRQFIEYMYRAFLGREYDENGMQDWLRAIKLGYTHEQIFNGFADSAEFGRIVAGFGL